MDRCGPDWTSSWVPHLPPALEPPEQEVGPGNTRAPHLTPLIQTTGERAQMNVLVTPGAGRCVTEKGSSSSRGGGVGRLQLD